MTTHPANTSPGKPSSEDIAKNFEDLHPRFNRLQAMAAASRCLYCYDAPCVRACPTSIDIPTFIRKIATNNPSGSARTILSENILGGTCARACPTETLCEQACVRNVAEDEPVEIGRLQRYAVDHLMEQDVPHPFTRKPATGKTIAIIGAGPAGLACAHRAAMLGHDAVIFEAKPKPGGLNEYGLAAYKMADDFAQKEVSFLMQVGGISIEYNSALGKDISIDDLKAKFDAVFIGVGLGGTNGLGVDGEDKDGVHDAVDFIEELRQAEDKSTLKVGDNIVVIGGGNTAIDAAVQAKRLGADEVTLVYRRGPEQMGATEWEQDLAKVNGVVVRHWAKPTEISGNGRVESISFEHTELQDEKLVGNGKAFELKADMVLKAVGQKLDESKLGGLKTERGKIVVDSDYQTSLAGVFAGGDCVKSGEDLTVQAVEDGKQAAHAIDRLLGQA